MPELDDVVELDDETELAEEEDAELDEEDPAPVLVWVLRVEEEGADEELDSEVLCDEVDDVEVTLVEDLAV